jgi:hypothetical protein
MSAPATQTQGRSASQPTARAIDRTLALAWRLLATAEEWVAAYGLSELGDIDLPPVVGSAADQARLQAVAPLYLASELEEARLVPAVEALAGLVVSGGLAADLGPTAPRLVAFWRGRYQRLAAQERQAIFAHLFGAGTGPTLAGRLGPNRDFEPLMIDLATALAQLEAGPWGADPTQEVAVGMAAGRLADNLVLHGGGLATFAARDLLAAVQQAIDLLGQVPVQRAVAAQDVWGAVRSISRSFLGEDIDIASRVTRGKAGMLVLAWLAQVAPGLGETGHDLAASGDSVVVAAGTWLRASQDLHLPGVVPAARRG